MQIQVESLRKVRGIGNATMDRIYASLQPRPTLPKINLDTVPSFTQDNITIYHGDALQIIPALNRKVAAIITDPPFGIISMGWDVVVPFEDMWRVFNVITSDNTPMVLFGNEPFSSALRMSNPHYKYDWVWEKERLVNIAQVKKRAGKTVENICVFYKSQSTYNPQMVKYHGKKRTNKVKNGTMGILCDSNTKSVKEYKDTGWRYPTQVLKFQRDILKSNLHPTQKPVKLMEYLIETYTNEGDTVIDPFMGSASTGIACMNTNRKFIGIELDEGYYEIAKKRIIEHDLYPIVSSEK